jgi:hypothetical protein
MIRRTYSVGSDTRNGGSSAPSLSPTTVVTPAQASNNFVGRRRSASESGGEWRVAISATHRRQTSPDQWTLVPLRSFFAFALCPSFSFVLLRRSAHALCSTLRWRWRTKNIPGAS